MKNILLIGDSIRIGYDNYVKLSMAPLAKVVFPAENCRFSGYVLRNLHNWTDELHMYEADLVHWNVGHWDTVRIYGDEPLTRPNVYADNLLRINDRIHFLFPNAKSVFATSTPVIEQGYIKDFEIRYNDDIRKYNDIAKRTLQKEGVIFNDLYQLLENRTDSLHSDQTHYYTPDATELIGEQVCKVLCNELDLDTDNLTYPDKNLFARPNVKGDIEMYEKYGQIYILKTETWKNREL